LTGCDEDSIHGIAYIPPENYKYASIDALSEIENKGNNKITELRTILQRESQNS
jgi:hypothetical protein